MDDTGVRWLDADQQRDWRALVLGTTLLFDRLDGDLHRRHGISLAEYEILVRLSERDGWRLRMAQLADSVRHSRSRVTHTVKRLEHVAADEAAALVERDGPAERGLVRRHGFVHVLAVQVHAGLEAQGVARAESGRLHPSGEERVPERLRVRFGHDHLEADPQLFEDLPPLRRAGCEDDVQDSSGNQIPISRSADSSESEPWTML